MNDLMTGSFLDYVELKKQARMDMETEGRDIEEGFHPLSEENFSQFFHQVDAIKSEMEVISSLLIDLQNLHEESKSTHSAKVLRGLRDRMDSNMVSVLRKANSVKDMLKELDRSNIQNRKLSESCKEGSCVDRTRISVTNGLRVKLREMMNDFLSLREMIVSDYKQSLKRRYFNSTGEEPSEEVMEKLMSGSVRIDVFEGKQDMGLENKERHDAVMDIQRSLTKLHQVFLDMAVLVEAQGEKMDDIEQNVMNAGDYISGGINSLFYAKQMKKKGSKWLFWVLSVVLMILVVCIISMLNR